MEKKYFDAVGDEKINEAKEILHIGRISWKLRDDDNLLLGRVESQLLRSIREGADRLKEAGRLKLHGKIRKAHASEIIDALKGKNKYLEIHTDVSTENISHKKKSQEKPRQLIGQPAAPGIVSGSARRIVSNEELGKFRQGEILVCDAIQPNMTHLVPLAAGIIERRGGMLIHGAIIAREMGIPCVNGVPNAAEILEDGELVTVDGFLGIVTIGEAEFEMEQQISRQTNK